MRGKRTIVMRILWGLGDVLCTTPAVRAYRAAYPQDRIVFRTYVKGVRRLEYDHGRLPGAGGAPDEMLWDNPNIDAIIDSARRKVDSERSALRALLSEIKTLERELGLARKACDEKYSVPSKASSRLPFNERCESTTPDSRKALNRVE